MRTFFAVAILLFVTTPATTQQCTEIGTYDDGTDAWGNEVKATVKQTPRGLVVFTANMDINTDGSLRSYKIDDLGHQSSDGRWHTYSALNRICSGVSIRRRDDTVLYNYNNCPALIAEFKRIRANNWTSQNGNYVEFYGIARATKLDGDYYRGTPCEKDGYYVSQTSLNTDTTRHDCDPERYIDALRIPAIVLTVDALNKAGVSKGDLVLVRWPQNGEFIGAIVGDTNRTKIGEATVITAMKLRRQTAFPRHYREMLILKIPRWQERVVNPEYIVFPKTAHLVPNLDNNSYERIQQRVAELAKEFKVHETEKLCN